jgi:hypothetical protein
MSLATEEYQAVVDNAILGVLVADAAALGWHWLYAREQLKNAFDSGRVVAFHSPEHCWYNGVAGYFAHGNKRAGDASHYGEAVLFWLELRLVDKATTRKQWQQQFAAHFGPGGNFHGYVDRPTRATVNAVGAVDPGQLPIQSGSADDDQNPALNAVLAALAIGDTSTDMAAVTHADAGSRQYASALYAGLSELGSGQQLSRAVQVVRERIPEDAQQKFDELSAAGLDHEAIASVANTACHLSNSVPIALHLLTQTGSFRQVVEQNIRLGGDSCGRALVLGALGGGAYTRRGIPAAWLMKLNNHHRIACVLDALPSRLATRPADV